MSVTARPFRFDTEKAIQAVGVLLRQESGNRLNYMKLLKLLSLAERESLRETGRMITGDKIVAMDRGPVPSNIYNLIKGQHGDRARWNSYIASTRKTYEVHLVADPGVNLLSTLEIDRLQAISIEHANHDEWDMVGFVADLPEYKKNKPPAGSSQEIPVYDILDAVGRGNDAEAIIAEASQQLRFSDFFQRHSTCSNATPT